MGQAGSLLSPGGNSVPCWPRVLSLSLAASEELKEKGSNKQTLSSEGQGWLCTLRSRDAYGTWRSTGPGNEEVGMHFYYWIANNILDQETSVCLTRWLLEEKEIEDEEQQDAFLVSLPDMVSHFISLCLGLPQSLTILTDPNCHLPQHGDCLFLLPGLCSAPLVNKLGWEWGGMRESPDSVRAGSANGVVSVSSSLILSPSSSSPYYVPGIILSTLHTLIHLILTTTLESGGR